MKLLIMLFLFWTIYRQRKRQRKFWVRHIYQNRLKQGDYHNLIAEMRLMDDEEAHVRYLRVTKETFDVLCRLVAPYLQKRRSYTNKRPHISPGEQLAMTLRFLASGDSQTSISYSFRVGKASVCHIIYKTCCVLWKVLHKKYLPFPSTEDEWKKISHQFWMLWQFPNCLGAIDGKHVRIQAPNNSGSMFFNYKGTFSIVLMAICDAHYRFIMVDIGEGGKESDGGVFSNCTFGQRLMEQSLQLPLPNALPGTSVVAPYVFVGDEAFPLRPDLLRPFPGSNLSEKQSVFNYRLSRARRLIENSFGILASRFRIYRQPIHSSPAKVVAYVKATIVLHNYLRLHESHVYCPPCFTDREDNEGNIINGEWRDNHSSLGLERIGRTGSNRGSWEADAVRETYCNYFVSEEGSLPWQSHHVHRTTYN
ncbi:PREDICTED: putative nuclease HARBI1 [Amphimedon queenslandica]|uniref:DDE Tnp4 domain-containing protein n=2 Tax=Amphimedon queenslandica TaxID=400682 RepID=A0AAN0IHR1_AMPQE|nr:PREDICTED: putative nuclease HARBI1 [Amphimedon queenslandica]|eukprot:XP_003389732.2 PREDICTED: putative nuclease HARBI1 [Amphimedon queenslandica]